MNIIKKKTTNGKSDVNQMKTSLNVSDNFFMFCIFFFWLPMFKFFFSGGYTKDFEKKQMNGKIKLCM
jgi:hypothetical protein